MFRTTVPETAINENGYSLPGESYVGAHTTRCPEWDPVILSESEFAAMKNRPYR